MRTKSALIVGMDGLVGAGLYRLFRNKRIRVCGTTRRNPVGSSDIFFDLADPDLSGEKLPQTDVAIICAAANGFAYCRSNPDDAKRVNVDGPRILARDLAARGTRVIYLSSSAVFDFSRPHMQPHNPCCPSTIYGASKAAGEESVLAVGELATIVRLTKVLTPRMLPLGSWIAALKAGDRIAAYSDLHFCPISLDYAVNALLAIAEARLPGIFHVSGAADISYFHAALRIAKRMALNRSRIIEDRAATNGVRAAEIARFTSLDASRYTALTGDVPPQPFEVLDAVYGPVMSNAAVAQ